MITVHSAARVEILAPTALRLSFGAPRKSQKVQKSKSDGKIEKTPLEPTGTPLKFRKRLWNPLELLLKNMRLNSSTAQPRLQQPLKLC